MTDPKLFDFAVTLKHETQPGNPDAGAYLVTDGIKDYWLPKKMTEDKGDGTFTIPEWLAIEKRIA